MKDKKQDVMKELQQEVDQLSDIVSQVKEQKREKEKILKQMKTHYFYMHMPVYLYEELKKESNETGTAMGKIINNILIKRYETKESDNSR